VAEVVSRDNGPTGLRRRKAAWTKGTDSGAISFSSIGKIDWEEGWHYVRVYAETEDGDRIPLADGEGNPIRFNTDAAETHASPNESDLFYVVTDDEVEVEPPQRAVPREASLMHALLRARFASVTQDRDPGAVSVTGCGWVERSSKAMASGETLEIRLGKEGKANVSCPAFWRTWSARFLKTRKA
jgi:DNA phosphorothioation-dependent restriction protein DptH